MNNNNNPNQPGQIKKPPSKFAPRRSPGRKWGILYDKFELRQIIKQNLKIYHFSYYQAAILHKLYSINKDTPKMYINEKELIKSTQEFFNLMTPPKTVKKKSVQSAISTLHKKNKIKAEFWYFDEPKGTLTLLAYHIERITDEMQKQIDVITELINKNQNKNKP